MRLIDADATKRRVADTYFDTLIPCVNHALDDSPTVDAVPVVRCVKCRNWVENDDGQYVCALFDIANSYGEPVVTKPDDFCSYGKRKGEAD